MITVPVVVPRWTVMIMNRAERRKAGKQNKPAVYMYTQDQIDKMIQDAVAKELAGIREKAVNQAINTCFKMFMSIPVMVLHDKFGFGHIRLDRFMHYALSWFEGVQEGDTALEEIMAIAEADSGIKVLDY